MPTQLPGFGNDTADDLEAEQDITPEKSPSRVRLTEQDRLNVRETRKQATDIIMREKQIVKNIAEFELSDDEKGEQLMPEVWFIIWR